MNECRNLHKTKTFLKLIIKTERITCIYCLIIHSLLYALLSVVVYGFSYSPLDSVDYTYQTFLDDEAALLSGHRSGIKIKAHK